MKGLQTLDAETKTLETDLPMFSICRRPLKIVVMVQEGEKGEFVNLVHTIRNSLAMNVKLLMFVIEVRGFRRL